MAPIHFKVAAHSAQTPKRFLTRALMGPKTLYISVGRILLQPQHRHTVPASERHSSFHSGTGALTTIEQRQSWFHSRHITLTKSLLGWIDFHPLWLIYILGKVSPSHHCPLHRYVQDLTLRVLSRCFSPFHEQHVAVANLTG